jgi:hypothetical protein
MSGAKCFLCGEQVVGFTAVECLVRAEELTEVTWMMRRRRRSQGFAEWIREQGLLGRLA